MKTKIKSLIASINRSLLRHDLFLLSLTLVLVCFSFSPNASGATFAPTEEERVAATEQGFNGELKLSVLPRKIDPEGRTYVEVDDMLFWVRESAGIESAFTGNPWTNGIVYYVFDAAVSSTDQQNWRDAAATWSAVAPLTFIEGTGIGNYIYVQNGSGNNSYVGMIGGPQVMNIFNWTYRYIIAHEIGHALGLIHEHQRSDRDSYVTINYSYIQSGYESNFYIAASTNYGTYDFDSVMHYDKCSFSTDCPPGSTCACTHYTITVPPPNTQWQDLIGQRDHLSQLDGAGMAQRYAGSGPPNDQCGGAIALSNGVTRTDSTANATSTGEVPTCQTNFGKGVWYTFTPATSGTVTVSTCGSNFDTVLQIYTGTCAAQSPYACDDDDGPDCPGLQASVTFNGTAGTTYKILAGGYASHSGNLQIVARLSATQTHPPFFTGENPLGNGVYYLQFPSGTPFGYYAYLADPLIYHVDMGYEYWFDANDGQGGIYFYDFMSTHLFYTNPSVFPFLYDFTLNTVLYYFPDPNRPGHYTTNPRYFYNLATHQIITM